MREAFCRALVAQATNPSFVFLTGDLGYKALEELRDALGDRFINAGVAEQNMVSVAAGLAKSGLRPWVYSIAPFIYARPFEQIRNDVCLHALPVVLVGNGGGYGYGVMGSSHHALEDYGSLLSLPGMRAIVPVFDEDLGQITTDLMMSKDPCYLRLGRSERPAQWSVPSYEPWRRIATGTSWTLVIVGPIAGTVIDLLTTMDVRSRPDVWVVSELPIQQIPDDFLESLQRSRRLAVVEEHREHGGVGQALAHRLLLLAQHGFEFQHFYAHGYLSGVYGSQSFHRLENHLDANSVWTALGLQ